MKMKEHINMSKVPKALIFFPAQSWGEAPHSYGLIPIYEKTDFFTEMRSHLSRVVELVKTSAVPAQQNPDGKWYTSLPYNKIVAHDSWCLYLNAHPDAEVMDKHFHGIDDFESLLQLTATDMIRPGDDTAVLLDVTDGESQPVVIDFLAWHASLSTHGWFKGTAEQLYDALMDLRVRTEGDVLELHTPWSVDVEKPGPTLKLKPFEEKVQFNFRASIKHSDNEELVTEELSISLFLAAVEDAVGSIR